jgi:hypothetical protein
MIPLATWIRTTAAALAVVPLLSLAGGAVAHAQSKVGFDAVDSNHDGRVTLQEYETFTTQRLMASSGRAAQKFKEMNPDQQESRLRARFNKLDRGHKGYLDRNDWPGG